MAASRTGPIAGAVLALTLALTGCVADAEPRERETPEPTREAPEATATPEDAPIQIPACDEMLSEAGARELAGDARFVAGHDDERLRDFVLEEGLGPVASETMRDAVQFRSCMWGLPQSDLLGHVFVAELTDDARRNLTTALDDSVFAREGDGSTVVYSHTGSVPASRWYWFRDDIWVAEYSTVYGPELGEALLEAVTAANP